MQVKTQRRRIVSFTAILCCNISCTLQDTGFLFLTWSWYRGYRHCKKRKYLDNYLILSFFNITVETPFNFWNGSRNCDNIFRGAYVTIFDGVIASVKVFCCALLHTKCRGRQQLLFLFHSLAHLPLPYLDTVSCFFSDPLCCHTTRVTERKTHNEMSVNRSDFFVNQSTGCLPVNMNNKVKIRKSGRETHTMATKPRVSTEIKVYLERRSRRGL